MASKPFDIILIGATGFTGKRAANYLKDNAPNDLNWGIAARNSEKLSAVADKLNLSVDRCFTVDTTDKKQVEAVVKRTKIVITTVGPFSLYGEEVIAACARSGTHYLDITGEVGFIKKMKDRYGDLAEQSGAKLIPFSGFDSIPADLSTLLLSREFDQPEKLNIKAYYSISGGFNGGTIATMLNKFETGEYKEMNDPRLLLHQSDQLIHPPENGHFFGYDKNINRWSSPFIMGAINSKVVYKSASIMRKMRKSYAKSISYSEHSSLGKWYNPLPFLFISLMLFSLTIFGPYKWFRTFLKKIMPAPGEGPSEDQIQNGYFKMKAMANDSQGNHHTLTMSYPGDPGNKSTVFFLCESALCLAESENNITEAKGFLTPATAFGMKLAVRLQQRGLQVMIDPE
ncbi:saccharopine dehydrogenase family protein [Gracilimonas halophila]|uniref:Saccharopine dehydrogenase family protein n=1 Tax=Gracilimonas halophila TaxID=1834464 RepID=A0ABW5JLX5_9BACT